MTTNTCTNPLQAARSSIQPSKRKNDRHKVSLSHEEENKSETKRSKTNTTTTTTTTVGYSQEKNQNDKKLIKARELWLRKIGAGYQLFIDYYSHQPIGTVCVDVDGTDSYPTSALHSSSNQEKNEGTSRQGLSRASLKRRRKVQKVDTTLDNTRMKHNEADSCLQEEIHTTKNCTVDKIGEENQSNRRITSSQQSQEMNHNANFLKKVYTDLAIETKNSTVSCCRSLLPFITSLSHDLPITFRIRKTAKISDKDGEMMASTNTLKDTVSRVFCPIHVNLHQNEDTIYQSIHNMSKKVLKLQYPDVNDALLKYSQNGILARQELGSMLPVLALQSVGVFRKMRHAAKAQKNGTSSSRTKKPLFSVLDMCASPGSKTLQILEVLTETIYASSASESPTVGTKISGNDTSLLSPNLNSIKLVANDIHPERLQALQDAITRSGIPDNITSCIKYTCQDAAQLQLTTSTGRKSSSFDIILCDVPCSGDGTCRKDSHILPTWRPSIGNTLHSIQIQILDRALELIKPDSGYVCYSTCSHNPIENEAVVQAVIEKWNRKASKPMYKLELVDIPVIPNIVLRPGITTWKVADFTDTEGNKNNTNSTRFSKTCHHIDDEEDRIKLTWYDSYTDAVNNNMTNARSTMWPKTLSTLDDCDTTKLDRKCCDNSYLQKCMRLHPQDQNSGGFFLCLIRKVSIVE